MQGRIDYPSVIGTTLVVAVSLFCFGLGVHQLWDPGVARWPAIAGIALLVSIAGASVGLYLLRRNTTEESSDKPMPWWSLILAMALSTTFTAFVFAGLEALCNTILRQEVKAISWAPYIRTGLCLAIIAILRYWMMYSRRRRYNSTK